MPFKSKAQRSYLFANEPEIAKRWAKEYPGQKNLPKRVKPKKKKGKAVAKKKPKAKKCKKCGKSMASCKCKGY